MQNHTSDKSLGNGEDSPVGELLALARLVEQDGVASDNLPGFLESMLSVQLAEPSALCRKAAMRLSTFNPPLEPHAVVLKLIELAREIETHEYVDHPVPEIDSRPASQTESVLKRIIQRVGKFCFSVFAPRPR